MKTLRLWKPKLVKTLFIDSYAIAGEAFRTMILVLRAITQVVGSSFRLST